MTTEFNRPRSGWVTLVLLVAIGLASLAARWVGIDYGLPHLSNLDERVYLSQYRDAVGARPVGQARPSQSAYPDLLVRAAACLPRAAPAAGEIDTARAVADASADLAFLRRVVAVLASTVVLGAWLLARRFTSSAWSLVVAALAGASVLHVCHATQARPHAIVSAAIVFAVVAAIDVARRGTWRASVIAALATGLALAVIQSGAAALPPLVVAHALRLRSDGSRALARLALALALVGLIFVLCYPNVLADAGRASGFLTTHGVSWRDFRGGGARAIVLAFWNHDPLLLLASGAALAGFVVALVKRHRPLAHARAELVVVLSFVVPFTVALALFQNTYHRFALPLFPFAALFAVLGLRSLGRAGTFLAGFVLVVQVACVVQVARLHAAPDTAELAADWLREHAARGTTRIAISPTTDVPLVRTSAALATENSAPTAYFAPWIEHQRSLPAEVREREGYALVDLPIRLERDRQALAADPRAFLRGLGARYVVIEAFDAEVRPFFAVVRAAARAEGTLVAKFAPDGERAPVAGGIEPYASAEYFPRDRFVWRIFGATALGPSLEIYRFDP